MFEGSALFAGGGGGIDLFEGGVGLGGGAAAAPEMFGAGCGGPPQMASIATSPALRRAPRVII
jgi:hypothetical protein